MKISVIIVCHNEGRDLEVTTAMAWASDPPPHEVIVVDDYSDPPLAPRLAVFDGVKVIRTEQQIGAGPAKRLGCEHATGDVFIILDAHMRMPMDWLAVVADAQELYPDALMCAVCRGFEMDGKFIGCGAYFQREGDIFLGRRWLGRGKIEEIDPCPCLLGACYIVPRHVWDRLGGINPNFIGWGYGEQDLSLRAWMSGFEVRRINKLVIPHRFNRKRAPGTFMMNTWHNGHNAYVTAATVFEDGVFERLYSPYFRQVYADQARETFYLNRPAVMAFREKVQAARVYSDDELHALCGFRLPTPHEQRQTVLQIIDKRAKNKRDARKREDKRQEQRERQLTPQMGLAHREVILSRLPENGHMLEWGAGGSTLWFREHLKEGQHLTTIEHNATWAKRIGGCLLFETDLPIASQKAEIHPGGEPPYLWSHDFVAGYDVIVVDGVLRNACLHRATALLNPGGHIFLHDAQRDWYPDGKAFWHWIHKYKPCVDYPGPELWEGTIPE